MSERLACLRGRLIARERAVGCSLGGCSLNAKVLDNIEIVKPCMVDKKGQHLKTKEVKSASVKSCCSKCVLQNSPKSSSDR